MENKKDMVIIDWGIFRMEAAKDAMCVLIGMGRDDGYKYSPHEVARYAIVYADELIKQLKEDKQCELVDADLLRKEIKELKADAIARKEAMTNKKYRIVRIERPHKGSIYKVQKRLFGSWGWWTIAYDGDRPAIYNTEGLARIFIKVDMKCQKTKEEVIYEQ